MVYRIYACPKAYRQIEALPKAARERIKVRLLELANDPRPAGCKMLEGSSDVYRIRVGDYRATYCIHDGTLMILVLRVANRREIYERKEIRGMVKDAKEWLLARQSETEQDE